MNENNNKMNETVVSFLNTRGIPVISPEFQFTAETAHWDASISLFYNSCAQYIENKHNIHVNIVQFYGLQTQNEIKGAIANLKYEIPQDYLPIFFSPPNNDIYDYLLIHVLDPLSPVYLYTDVYMKTYGLIGIYDNFYSLLETESHKIECGAVFIFNDRLLSNSIVETTDIDALMNPQSEFYRIDLMSLTNEYFKK